MKFSVSLPLYKAKEIAWLCLESLCNQHWDSTIKWELIVAEEIFSKSDPYTEKEILKEYEYKLKMVGCDSIIYIPLKEHINLAFKLKMIADHANTDILFLCAADCYSQPYRFIETMQILEDKTIDFVYSPIGPIYIIKTGEMFLYNTIHDISITTGLNMAIRTRYLRDIEVSEKVMKQRRGIDKWMVESSKEITTNWKSFVNESPNFKYGIDTHGCNNITKNRYIVCKQKTDIFTPNFKKWQVPSYIIDRLQKIRVK